MTEYKTKRIIDGKSPLRTVIVDEAGNVVNINPTKEELKGLEKEPRDPRDTRKNASKKQYTEKELLDYPRIFYEKYGRVPTSTDFTGNPEYPSSITYQREFGSWANVLRLVELDVESMVKKGVLETTSQKARFTEMIIRDHFEKLSIDLAGENCISHCDGICPNGKTYDVKSSGLYKDNYYHFTTRNKYKEEIEIYYFLGFDKHWTKLDYGWRIPGEIVEKDYFHVGLNSNFEFNIKNMKKYDITDKLTDVIRKYEFFNKKYN